MIDTLLNTKLNQIEELNNHVAALKSGLPNFVALRMVTDESMTFAPLLSSISSFHELTPVVAFVNTLEECSTSGKFVVKLFYGKYGRLTQTGMLLVALN